MRYEHHVMKDGPVSGVIRDWLETELGKHGISLGEVSGIEYESEGRVLMPWVRVRDEDGKPEVRNYEFVKERIVFRDVVPPPPETNIPKVLREFIA